MAPLALSVLVGVLLIALWIGGNAYRYRKDVWHHWYSVGYRDGERSEMQYGIQYQQSPFIVNAYLAGYADGKDKVWQR